MAAISPGFNLVIVQSHHIRQENTELFVAVSH